MKKITVQKCKLCDVPFAVKEIRAEDGERFSILINNSDGMPLFMPTIYSTSILRGDCKASNTIKANLGAIKVLYTWAAINEIDIERRFRSGDYLTLIEIDSLARIVCLPYKELAVESGRNNDAVTKSRVISIERARAKNISQTQGQIGRYTAAIRIAYISEYLDWLAVYFSGNATPSQRINYDSGRRLMIEQLKARKSSSRQHSVLGQREGMSPEVQQRLEDCLQVGSELNPWENTGLQVRNRLLVFMLLTLGVRRGELLGITCDNILGQARKIKIIRNADDPSDPRTYEPNTKTRDRELELAPWLYDMILGYVTKIRAGVKGAKKHQFLFVAHDSGSPLSLSGFNKVFTSLRTRVPGLPKNLSAHVMRHTWNDHFSRICDDEDTKESEEIKMRCEQMGWSPTSESAIYYTRRTTRERSQKMSLKLQNDLVAKIKDIDNDKK